MLLPILLGSCTWDDIFSIQSIQNKIRPRRKQIKWIRGGSNLVPKYKC